MKACGRRRDSVGGIGENYQEKGDICLKVLKNEKEAHLWVEGLISDKSGRGAKTV